MVQTLQIQCRKHVMDNQSWPSEVAESLCAIPVAVPHGSPVSCLEGRDAMNKFSILRTLSCPSFMTNGYSSLLIECYHIWYVYFLVGP
jgi:hypothetical protein